MEKRFVFFRVIRGLNIKTPFTMILLCLGSNHLHEQHFAKARHLLTATLPSLHFTRTIWTEPIGFSSPPYLNGLAYSEQEIRYEALLYLTKDIERQLGRRHDDSHEVSIDIDILQCGDQKYHDTDWERSYVRELLHEVP